MTLRDYKKLLNKLTRENPKALDAEVIYAKDEEGNEYGKVFYAPSLNDFDEFKNAVCIN